MVLRKTHTLIQRKASGLKRVQNWLREYIAEKELTYYIETYGCQMNNHESEKIAGVLESLGYCHESDKVKADVIVFNTCCIRQHAEAKLNSNVGALKDHKKTRKNAVIVVSGCMMQQEEAAKKLMTRFPFVDIAFGTNAIHRLDQMLCDVLSEGKRVIYTDEDESIVEDVPAKRQAIPTAYVNIIYGCNNFCTYCVVPYVRGRERSRKSDDIFREIRTLADQGISEIVLLGQNVNSYGNDADGNVAFPQLLRRIDSETNIKRLRFMTSHPKDMSDALIECYGSVASLCEHIHLPVQSGSNRILEAMNRGYTREHYLSLLRRLKARVPSLAVTTDIIAGFPGETDEDFDMTLSLVEEAGFDAAYTFAYSPRHMTKAAGLPDHISKQAKKERLGHLNALIKSSMQRRNAAYLGQTVEVLIDSHSRRSQTEIGGRTRTAKTVNLEGQKEEIGSFVTVEIDKIMVHTLRGRRV